MSLDFTPFLCSFPGPGRQEHAPLVHPHHPCVAQHLALRGLLLILHLEPEDVCAKEKESRYQGTTREMGCLSPSPRSTSFCGNCTELALTVGFKAVGLRMNICVYALTTTVHGYKPSGKHRTLHVSLRNVDFWFNDPTLNQSSK